VDPYEVRLTTSARRQLRSLEPQVRDRLEPSLRSLVKDPRPAGVTALQGRRGYLRIRVGDYRIVYQVQDDVLLVLVVQIGHRREVYRDF
jgi:mRNA interferase RelE/StbE